MITVIYGGIGQFLHYTFILNAFLIYCPSVFQISGKLVDWRFECFSVAGLECCQIGWLAYRIRCPPLTIQNLVCAQTGLVGGLPTFMT